MTALGLIVLCGALSIVYAIWATMSVLKSDAGNPRMQEIAAGRRDFPTFVIPQHITASENVDRGDPQSKPPDPRAPLRAACREDRNVPVERGERGSAAAMTGQYL